LLCFKKLFFFKTKSKDTMSMLVPKWRLSNMFRTTDMKLKLIEILLLILLFLQLN
jgi:hypothetical protein